jgi:4-amino-4-deoxy-L-arabinose transferase-like glycosyltransferase
MSRDRLTQLWCHHRAWQAVVLLVALWAVLFLPMVDWRGLRFEEGRRAVQAWHMLQTGDVWLLQVLGDAYVNKPPGLPWLMALAGLVTDSVEWAVRLPPLMFSLGGILAVYGFARPRLGPGPALYAGLAFLFAPHVLHRTLLGETDLPVTVCLFVAFWAWWGTVIEGRAGSWRWPIFAAAVGFALLLKGPPPLAYLAVPILAIGIAQRRWHGLALTLLWTGIGALPLAYWAWINYQPGRLGHWSDEMRLGTISSLGAFDVMERLENAVEAIAMFLPWLIPAVIAFWPAWVRRHGQDPLLAAALTLYAVPIAALMLVWPGAVDRYMMPAVPAVAVAAAMAARVGWPMAAWRRAFIAALPVIGLGYQLALMAIVLPGREDIAGFRTIGQAVDQAVAEAGHPPDAPLTLVWPRAETWGPYAPHNPLAYVRPPLDRVDPSAADQAVPPGGLALAYPTDTVAPDDLPGFTPLAPIDSAPSFRLYRRAE